MRLTENNQTTRSAHDSLLQNVNSLVLQLHAMAIRFRNEEAVRSALDLILKNAERLVEPGRYQMMGQQFLPQYDCDFEQLLADLAQVLSDGKHCQCSLVVIGDYSQPYLSMRDDLYHFAREALTNVYRHAGAQKVEIELTYACSGLRLQIRDDGAGFLDGQHPISGLPGRSGLNTMQDCALRLRGSLYICSAKGMGTEVSLDVPLHVQQSKSYFVTRLACMRRHLGLRH
ncbi:sensor histidine kinase [Undibacterium sp. Ji50W]|uniref:sensor histidine kinase n=1 Tax=Undibacterium sp. Ji50W TaxID=3413041 RepID=UPI003BF13A86